VECKSRCILGHAYGGLHYFFILLFGFLFFFFHLSISLGGISLSFRLVSFIFKIMIMEYDRVVGR
jgi:hypothetical protein